jgi:hypothetical protein
MLIGEAILRANPGYDLVPLDHLTAVERQAVEAEAGRQRAPYGLLRSISDGVLEPRIVSTDTALLFLTLLTPGPCPGYLRNGLGDRLTSTLGRLILDGILEVEVDRVFRSGAAGWAPLAPADEGRRGGRTAALSEEAIRYGDALLELGSLPVESIATRLYMYGRRPVNAALRRLVASWDPLGGAGPTLRQRWIEQPPTSPDSPWRSWQPRRSPTGRTPSSSPFKLYVSPTTETLPAAVRAVASALAGAPGVLGFKVGRTVDGVARPDKMVAYFSNLDDLHGAADRVRDQAADCRPHGVPFTAGVTDDGLLSWAIDPPRNPGGTEHHATGSSWRAWVSMRLADYLLDARASNASDAREPGGEPWQVALARLQLDGVDTVSWVPGPRIFDGGARG